MASKTSSGTPKMIVQYEWIFENVEKEPKTFASKMILFRGEKVFRTCLKNTVELPELFFIAIDLNKIGLKIEEVMFGIQGSGIGPATITKMEKENIGEEGNLQLFKTNFVKQIVGKCTFVFRIRIEGSVSGYSYRLSDRLAKDQLWEAAKSKNLVDVEFVVKSKKFYAHKVVLAARSPAFAAEFTEEEQPDGEASGQQVEPGSNKRKRNYDPLHHIRKEPVIHQIRIDAGVKPSTVEHFLYFIYTGEPMGTLANEELLKLARRYKFPILTRLCKVALQKIDATQMVKLSDCLHNAEKPSSSTVKPDKDTELFFDRTTPTFRCDLSFNGIEDRKPKCLMKYQNEDLFSAYFTGERVTNPTDHKRAITKPVFHLSCSEHRRFGFKIEDVYFMYDNTLRSKWFRMESKHLQKNVELLQHFSGQMEGDIPFDKPNTQINFDVKTVSTIGNYYYEVMDDDWIKDFWKAATTKQNLTDVEIFAGKVKVMEAHRIILSARSPVMDAYFKKLGNTGKCTFTFDAGFDEDIVKYFLKFLYAGSFKSSAKTSVDYKKLLKLATMYEVETLKNMCQLVVRAPPDVEEFTNCLLEL